MLLNSYRFKASGIQFDLVFENRLLLIGGNSGVGKTMVFKRIRSDALLNNKNIRCINIYDKDLVNISELIRKKSGFIFVIDNADLVLSDSDKYFISLDKRNQYIIFTHNISGFKPGHKSNASLIYKDGVITLDYVNKG